jgi:hypothetical protein
MIKHGIGLKFLKPRRKWERKSTENREIPILTSFPNGSVKALTDKIRIVKNRLGMTRTLMIKKYHRIRMFFV